MHAKPDLWTLTRGRPQIDPNDLAEAVAAQAAAADLDYRTRMLIHDSIDALRHYWDNSRLEQWLGLCSAQEKIQAICHEEFDKVGFPSLKRRVMDKTKPEVIEQFLEHLGRSIRREVTINIAFAGRSRPAGSVPVRCLRRLLEQAIQFPYQRHGRHARAVAATGQGDVD